MFPITDSSETIIDCLIESAKAAGVKLVASCAVQRLSKRAEGGFEVALSTGKTDVCDRVLLATGGCRTVAAGQLAVSLGNRLEPPVPSLFTFHTATPWLHKLAGISVESAEVAAPGTGLRENGALLLTHSGLSGPVILRLSAWGARELHDRDYQFPLHVNWLAHFDAEQIALELNARREQQPARLVVNTPIAPLPARLW
jgi:predicted Rossmann fold flavoprotein